MVNGMDRTVQTPDKARPADTGINPVDASVDIIVSDDEQSAYLAIKPPEFGGREITFTQMLSELEKKRVVHGIKADVLKALTDKPEYNKMIQVAQGEVPVQGADAKLTFHFNLSHEIKPRERADGTVDYRDLGLIEAVTAGQKLCTLTPADKGTPGKTVTGRVILPNTVRNFGLPLGKNTKVSEDKLVLLAALGGSVEYVNGKVNVHNVFTVHGDVDISTGNINFDGSVIVNGDIMAGFTVKASGNINVVGNVEGATLEAGGDIKIVAGLVGQGRGKANCGGSFKALFVENAEIVARGDVTADVFMHSQVQCSGSLIADGRRGAIIGGSYVVGKDVRATTVGTQSGVPTAFELGIDPTINERIKYLNDRERTLDNELAKLSQIVQLLYPLRTAGKLTQDKGEILDKAIATKEGDTEELAGITRERSELTNASGGIPTSQFICKRELFYGAKITISQVVFTVPSDLIRCKIYLNPQREITMVSMA